MNSSSDLFGEEAMYEVLKRVSILENFRKSASTADPKPQANRFLGGRTQPPSTGVGWAIQSGTHPTNNVNTLDVMFVDSVVRHYVFVSS